MSTSTCRYAFALSVASSLGALFACTSDGESAPPEVSQPAPPDADLLPDAGVDAADPSVDASVVPDAGRCSEDGFCYTLLPVQQPLMGVSASSMDDAWAIGRDVVLRWDGTAWKVAYVQTAKPLFGIVVAKRDDVWVLGPRLLVRYAPRDGQAPAFRESTNLRATAENTTGFWVNSESNDLWIAITASQGSVRSVGYRYHEEQDGQLTETLLSDPPISFPWTERQFAVHAIFGFGSSDVYVGGEWCDETESCTLAPPYRLVPHLGAIAHYDGTDWKMVALLERGERVSAIHGETGSDGAKRLWVWTGIAGRTANSIRILPVGSDRSVGAPTFGQPLRTDQSSTFPFPPISYDNWLAGCNRVQGSVTGAGVAWFSDVCFVYRWDGTSLQRTPTSIDSIPIGSVTGVWAGSADEAWIVGEAPRPFHEAPPTGFAGRRRRVAP